jgi:hypothetical protein
MLRLTIHRVKVDLAPDFAPDLAPKVKKEAGLTFLKAFDTADRVIAFFLRAPVRGFRSLTHQI